MQKPGRRSVLKFSLPYTPIVKKTKKIRQKFQNAKMEKTKKTSGDAPKRHVMAEFETRTRYGGEINCG